MLLAVVIALCAARQTTAQSSGNGLDDVLANDGLYFTTNFGQPVFSENASLTVGDRGGSTIAAELGLELPVSTLLVVHCI